MPPNLDRFNELISAIRDVANQDRISAATMQAVDRQQRVVYGTLLGNTPRKTGATHVSTGHSHTAIQDGWRKDRSRKIRRGAKMSISNSSEHIDVQRFGTIKKKYQIPLNPTRGFHTPGGRLEFWLGAPLKWPVRKAKFRKPGFVNMALVEHPGIRPWGGSDFVERTARDVIPAMKTEAFAASEKIAFEPLKRFFT